MPQKRILFFVQDGTGLGHLSRISRIAASLQGPYSVLLVSAKREASWMVPASCEFIRLPSWSAIRQQTADKWNRPVWLEIENQDAAHMISEFNNAVAEIFNPDFIFTDYRPLGLYGELKKVLNNHPAKKYLILRGIIDFGDLPLFSKEKTRLYSKLYDGVLVACDPRIVNVGNDYKFCEELCDKTETIGYISSEPADREQVRAQYSVAPGKTWVVCSSGGGFRAEAFLAHCIKAAASFHDVVFDVVAGPYSNQAAQLFGEIPANCRLHQKLPHLSTLLYSCDISVINGGYNSLVESMSGGAHIIVFPNQVGLDDEQLTHSRKLSKFYPITVLRKPKEVTAAIKRLLDLSPLPRPVANLRFDGQARIKEILDANS